jgi:hypothetical protein
MKIAAKRFFNSDKNPAGFYHCCPVPPVSSTPMIGLEPENSGGLKALFQSRLPFQVFQWDGQSHPMPRPRAGAFGRRY